MEQMMSFGAGSGELDPQFRKAFPMQAEALDKATANFNYTTEQYAGDAKKLREAANTYQREITKITNAIIKNDLQSQIEKQTSDDYKIKLTPERIIAIKANAATYPRKVGNFVCANCGIAGKPGDVFLVNDVDNTAICIDCCTEKNYVTKDSQIVVMLSAK